MTRHGRDCPDRCSICRGAVVKHIDTQDGSITVDGTPVRPIDPGTQPNYGTVATRRKRRGKR